jgi:hypothetical protein
MKIISALYHFDLIHVDVFGPLTRSESGNRYIIIVVDHYSKFVIAIAVPDFTALTTARFIVNQTICKYGMPGRICTDQNVNFESELFKYMCDLLRIAKVRILVSYVVQSTPHRVEPRTELHLRFMVVISPFQLK